MDETNIVMFIYVGFLLFVLICVKFVQWLDSGLHTKININNIDLGADSLDLFELVMALEEEYGMEIPAEELTEIATVGDVLDYLADKGIEA